jgi:hypothetical protein
MAKEVFKLMRVITAAEGVPEPVRQRMVVCVKVFEEHKTAVFEEKERGQRLQALLGGEIVFLVGRGPEVRHSGMTVKDFLVELGVGAASQYIAKTPVHGVLEDAGSPIIVPGGN